MKYDAIVIGSGQADNPSCSQALRLELVCTLIEKEHSVFTDPQLGRIGMTEKEARGQGHRLKIGKIPMS